MSGHVLTAILLGIAVGIAIVCGVGVMVMRDAYQRLHYPTPVVSISALLITVAVFLEDADAGSRTKMVIIFVLMFWLNSVLSHATARAVRIKNAGQWPIAPGEKIILHDTGRLVQLTGSEGEREAER